jgi:hypothetical protein
MTLTRRPTRLSRDPDRNDWSTHDDGAEIGRQYEDRTASRAELRWFWSIIVMGPARHRVRTDGRAPTFETAGAEFATSSCAWLEAAELTEKQPPAANS